MFGSLKIGRVGFSLEFFFFLNTKAKTFLASTKFDENILSFLKMSKFFVHAVQSSRPAQPFLLSTLDEVYAGQ